MKRMALLGILGVLCATAASSAEAEDAVSKLGRGLVNTTTGVLEIPRHMSLSVQELYDEGYFGFTALPSGIIKGLLPGVWDALKRTGVGLYETLTFPVAGAKRYAPVYTPTTVFTKEQWTYTPPAGERR